MTLPPPLPLRPPRAHLETITPAVLRFDDGSRVASRLQVVSLTGGLLWVRRPIARGSQVKLMFLAGGGSVLGRAELLGPLTGALQPFRFLDLPQDDRHRLGSLIQASIPQPAVKTAEDVWIEKFRAASLNLDNTPRFRTFKRAMGAVGFITLALAGAMYYFHFSVGEIIGR